MKFLQKASTQNAMAALFVFVLMTAFFFTMIISVEFIKGRDRASETAALKDTVKILQADIAGLRQEISRQREIYPVSRGGSRVRGMIENAQVTWYNDEGYTASGTIATEGRTVAVDPTVIPLGSRLHIVMPDSTVYERVAEDTGGAVKGAVIDIRSNAPDSELLERGRTEGAKVFILER